MIAIATGGPAAAAAIRSFAAAIAAFIPSIVALIAAFVTRTATFAVCLAASSERFAAFADASAAFLVAFAVRSAFFTALSAVFIVFFVPPWTSFALCDEPTTPRISLALVPAFFIVRCPRCFGGVFCFVRGRISLSTTSVSGLNASFGAERVRSLIAVCSGVFLRISFFSVST